MSHLLGEFDCKIDTKGRLMIPSGLKKQLPNDLLSLVVNRGFEQNLVLYTRLEWDSIILELSRLNTYEKRNRDFVRYFTRGATEIGLDNASRILLPKVLLDYARISGEVVLLCQLNKIEIWDKSIYESQLDNEPENFAKLAEEVMGKNQSLMINEQ